MRHTGSRIAVLLILTLLAQSAPSFAQARPQGPRAAAFFHHGSAHSSAPAASQSVDVMTPAQFVDPPAFTRHPILVAAGTYGIIVGTLYVIAKLFVPFT